jgi:hypothetical protein
MCVVAAGIAYLSWLSDARKALVLGTDNFIARDFSNAAEFLDPSRLLPLLGQLDLRELLGPHWGRLQRRFKSPRIAAMLSFQDLYVGLSPYSAPGENHLNLRCALCSHRCPQPVAGKGSTCGHPVAACSKRTQSCARQVKTAPVFDHTQCPA